MRCNFYEYERKLQHEQRNITFLQGVISMNMKGNYNEHIGQMGICDDVILINMKGIYK